jgi:hypothetical protein
MSYSLSASKVESKKSKPIFNFREKEESPTYRVDNFPIKHSAKQPKKTNRNDVFFSE